MPLPETAVPVPMLRVAVVAPGSRLREALVGLAQAGCVEPVVGLPPASGAEVDAMRRLERSAAPATASPPSRRHAPDARATGARRRRPLLAGEAELARARGLGDRPRPRRGRRRLDAARRGRRRCATALAGCGAALVELPRPAWTEPPTLLGRRGRRARSGRWSTMYGAARYRDLDPTPFAAVTFVLMFGMMFGDVGHGLLLAAAGARCSRARARAALAPWRRLWPMPVACGLSAAAFGLLYGEAFGPTGLVPTLWLDARRPPDPAARRDGDRRRRRPARAQQPARRRQPRARRRASARRWSRPAGIAGPRAARRRAARAGRLARRAERTLARRRAGARRLLAPDRCSARASRGAGRRRDGRRRDRSSSSSTPSCARPATPSRSPASPPSGWCTRRSPRRCSTARAACRGGARRLDRRGRTVRASAMRPRSRSRRSWRPSRPCGSSTTSSSRACSPARADRFTPWRLPVISDQTAMHRDGRLLVAAPLVLVGAALVQPRCLRRSPRRGLRRLVVAQRRDRRRRRPRARRAARGHRRPGRCGDDRREHVERSRRGPARRRDRGRRPTSARRSPSPTRALRRSPRSARSPSSSAARWSSLGLAEGIAVYGLIVALILIGKA